MIRVGLVGLGFMGTAHFNVYKNLAGRGVPVELVAICDVDQKKFEGGAGTKGNLDVGSTALDLSGYRTYEKMADMIEKENLDYVDLCLPTYLHSPMAVEAMKLGVHVFCEKPMAISSELCQRMIDTSVETGKKLMIGQTLRYWNVYEYAKKCIDEKTYGEVVSGYFFRGGTTPIWSWENWLLQKDKAGGSLLDQHIHDVDAINWLFGVPEAVSTAGKVVVKTSGYDAVSTNYLYESKIVINAQDDWMINGDGFGFSMEYRINFEKGALVYNNKAGLTVHPEGGTKFAAELCPEDAYEKEIRYFVEHLDGTREMDLLGLLKSHRETIVIAEAEIASADHHSQVTAVQV